MLQGLFQDCIHANSIRWTGVTRALLQFVGLDLHGTFNSFNFAVGIMEFALDFFVVLVDFCESC